MNSGSPHFRNVLIAIATAAPLALAGCGGGSSTMTGDESDMMPMNDVEPLTVPDGLAQSPATPVHASDDGDTLAGLLSDPANMFAPLLSMFSGDPSAESPRAQLSGDMRVKTVSSDGENGFHVTYEAGSEEHMIHFEAADYNQGQHYYSKTVDGALYWLGSWTDLLEGIAESQSSSQFTYFEAGQFGQSDETTNATDRNFLVYGARTDGANLPAGSAEYTGPMYAQTYPSDDPSAGDRDRMRGSMRLAADFDDGALTGMVFAIRSRRAGESDYARLSDTAYFVIGSGRIADGRFTASLTGEDSNEDVPMDETVRGYEGNVLGEFYGPSAEEVGAVLNATRSDRVLYGWLGGWQPDPNPSSGLHRSAAAPVFATHDGGNLEDLFDAGAVFAPLTSTVERNRNHSNGELSGDSYVKTISGNTAGRIRFTYVVDGEEQMVAFGPEDSDGDESWSKGEGPWAWLSGGGDYYDTGRLGIPASGGGLRFVWTAGARTNAADLPAGSATYVGYMRGESFGQVLPSNDYRYSMSGDVSLTADFDASTLDGTISNIEVRWSEPRPRVWIDLPDTTHFDISDGQIADGQFAATLTGVDTNEHAPLHDSVRGYEGDVLGEFYGPAAEEVGGVISATRDADLRVMAGTIHGGQEEQ